MAIKVIINGANGRMGREAVLAVDADNGLELVGQTGRNDDLAAAIQSTNADVVVDLTVPDAAFSNTMTIIEAGSHPVIGTSGLSPEDIAKLEQACAEKQLGALIVPNFSIGAVLMMRYAKDAMKYFSHAEIIELHHDGKKDAPSGTAVKTAQMMSTARQASVTAPECKELISGARGADCDAINIHSIRLPGLVAHQEVIFGGHYETLTIRHDSMHRQSFMPGVCLSCHKVMELDKLIYGLDTIL